MYRIPRAVVCSKYDSNAWKWTGGEVTYLNVKNHQIALPNYERTQLRGLTCDAM
jgi:hypothetical protein